MADYASAGQIRAAAIADEETTDSAVWDNLATAVSRQFDKECEVADNFFAAAPGVAAASTFYANGTRFLYIGELITGSITDITVDGVALDAANYRVMDEYLYFDEGYEPETEAAVAVTARFGFSATPADIVQACIEEAVWMWRRRDPAFAEMSGNTAGTAQGFFDEFTPTFRNVAKRYREQYSNRSHFA